MHLHQQTTCRSSNAEIVALVGLAFVYVAGGTLVGAGAYDPLNFYGPIVFTVILAYGSWFVTVAEPAGIWTPLVWVRVVTAVFSGFGSVVPFIANDVTMAVINHFYHASPEEMYRVNLITTLAVLTLLFTARMIDRELKPINPFLAGQTPSREMLTWGLILGGLGAVIKFIIVLPYSFGLIPWQVPGFVLQLSMMGAVGIYLAGSWAFTYSRLVFVAVCVYAALELFVGLMTFSKTDVLFPIIMLGLATAHRGVSALRILPTAGLVTATFILVAPIVDFGRTALSEKYGSITGAGIEERLVIIENYFSGGRSQFQESDFRAEFQGSLARLSSMNQAAFAVAQYDSENYGDSLEAIAVVVIPRFLWPGKPNMNYLGANFTLQANGGANLTWPGRYAEVYWNWGWWGIALLIPPLGIVYALLSRYVLWVFAAQRWAYFPVVLASMRYGIDITGPYATAGVGGLLHIVALHFGAKVVEVSVEHLFGSKRASRQFEDQPVHPRWQ